MIKSESIRAKSSAHLMNSSASPLHVLLKNLLFLIIGLILGVQFTLLWFNETFQCSRLSIKPSPITEDAVWSDTAVPQNLIINETTHYSEDLETISADIRTTNMAQYLYNSTRVLCWVMTYPENPQYLAIHIKHTWGRRCNTLLFMSSTEDEELPTIALPIEKEGPDQMWNKTKLALKYIYDNHLDDADWFLKADDDT